MSINPADKQKEQILRFKIKRMLKELSDCRGNGTSLVTIMIPDGGDLNGMKRLLVNEYGTATNIKSRVNRLSVLSAITSAQHKLKNITKLPKNGLVLYCGEAFMDNANKTKKICSLVEPVKPLLVKMYMCDNRFHVEPLYGQLTDHNTYGFIIVDGKGAFFATLCGEHRTVLYHYKVDLPQKHNMGGQSAARFGRLAEEARCLYIKKVGEFAITYFIENDILSVKGVIIAGSAEMKDRLTGNKFFDQRIKRGVISLITIGYGGKSGFEEAINKSSQLLGELRFVEEQKLLENYFTSIAKDTGLYCYGIRDTMYALEQGAVNELIVYEDLNMIRCEISFLDDNGIVGTTTGATGATTREPKKEIHYVNSLSSMTDEINKKYGDQNIEISTKEPLLDWFIENIDDFGANLHIISDATPEGRQFTMGFGGIGGTLRWKLDFGFVDAYEDDFSDDFSDDFI